MDNLYNQILASDLTQPHNVNLMYELARNRMDSADTAVSGGRSRAILYANRCKDICYQRMADRVGAMPEWFKIYKKCLLLLAPYQFDDYLLYLEINRRPQDKFYMPRRRILKEFVDKLQALEDGNLQEMFLSCPPRIGKTALLVFYVTWLIGKDSGKANLYVSYTDQVAEMFYNGVLAILRDNYTYTWGEIFPGHKIVSTNSKEHTLNLDKPKQYPTFTGRGIDGSLNGKCDCSGVLIADDLVSGMQEALSRDRLNTLWGKVDNDMLTRAKESARILWVGTRWSIYDPIGKRLDLVRNEPSFKERIWTEFNIPALNKDDESNFDYDYGVGFSTEYYHQRRKSFERNNDVASWSAQYMGTPIERDGVLFLPDGMNYFNGVLPDEDPVAVYSSVDVAWGGGDYLSMPIIKEYENGDKFVVGWLFDNRDKSFTIPAVVNAIKRYGIGTVDFEQNNGGGSYADEVDRRCKELGIRVKITKHSAPSNKRKEERINEVAPEIRELFFLNEGNRDKEYSLAMNNLFSFSIFKRQNKHDDAPDSLAMAINYHARTTMAAVKIVDRPW